MKRTMGAGFGIAIALIGARIPAATACDALEIDGRPPIKVNSEAAIIIWDKAHQTEHFIRRASFDSSGKNMGFLVPTPHTPTVTAASDDLFGSLDRAMEPRSVSRTLTGYSFIWAVSKQQQPDRRAAYNYLFEPAPRDVAANHPGTGRPTAVGGYTATVFAARDEQQLNHWLRANKFKTDAGTMDWLRPYVQRGWSITAFKIKPGKTVTQLSPVRLSFKTDKPYYPYREPAAARAKGNYAKNRDLRVYYLATERGAGTIGAKTAWPGVVQWSAMLPDAKRTDLVEGTGLSPSQIPANARLTIFEDIASPRHGTDEVYFRPAPNQSELSPQPVENVTDRRIKIPMELVVLAIILTSVSVWVLRGPGHYNHSIGS